MAILFFVLKCKKMIGYHPQTQTGCHQIQIITFRFCINIECVVFVLHFQAIIWSQKVMDLQSHRAKTYLTTLFSQLHIPHLSRQVHPAAQQIIINHALQLSLNRPHPWSQKWRTRELQTTVINHMREGLGNSVSGFHFLFLVDSDPQLVVLITCWCCNKFCFYSY